MINFVGAGSGAADLITVRGAKLLGEADVIIYAGSLVNPESVSYTHLDVYKRQGLSGYAPGDCAFDPGGGRGASGFL